MRALGLLVLCVGLLPLTGQRGQPSIAEIEAVERNFDQGLQHFGVESPMDVLGLTRGVYLEGYGAVFTSEVNLLRPPSLSPFRPTLTKAEVVRIRMAKLKRLPELRGLMKEVMVASAGSLDRLPNEERLVLGVRLFYSAWEDTTGLPRQITMQARKGALVDVATNRQPRAALATILTVREE
jgi:hypothetical protein